jgi:hypothetical protein
MRLVSVPVVALLLTVSACGGSSGGSGTDQSAALKREVTAYSRAYLGGHGASAYALQSTRCKKATPLPKMLTLASGARSAYGPMPITSYTAKISGHKATVTYGYSVSTLDQKAQPWVLQTGGWRYDSC